MTSLKPYLIRAVYDWIVENGLTPHVLAYTEEKDTNLPLQYARDGKIILNVHPKAIHNLSLGVHRISFDARFGGIATHIELPVSAVLAIYAKENGKGIILEEEQGDSNIAYPKIPKDPKHKSSKPNLKVVK